MAWRPISLRPHGAPQASSGTSPPTAPSWRRRLSPASARRTMSRSRRWPQACRPWRSPAADRVRRRLGERKVIWLSLTTTAPAALLVPFTQPGAGLCLYAAGLLVVSFGAVVYNVNQAAYRQLLCPPALLGRVNATVRFIVWGALRAGSLIGGALPAALGDRNALWVATVGIALSPLWLLLSPSPGAAQRSRNHEQQQHHPLGRPQKPRHPPRHRHGRPRPRPRR